MTFRIIRANMIKTPKGIKRKSKTMTREVVVCDNRIDKIDKKYYEHLYASNVNVEDNQLISVV